ncbi:hypothetical protein SAMN05661080_03630 [Modestobacter sp. DSM 44400]|nr:hypothetical protein SAMN05661080_01612 [Modestobacter sp. DSM 44400]SDY49104.1 hypothetical protein SAMN05661080_03630 [Modestobacter sp. DSM 44400]
MVVSLTFPPVRPIDSALPRPSQIRCSLLVQPPRERPNPWSTGSGEPRPTQPTWASTAGFLSFDSAPCVARQVRDSDLPVISLGAYRVQVGQGPDVSWVVLADPEGNEFCVLTRSVQEV